MEALSRRDRDLVALRAGPAAPGALRRDVPPNEPQPVSRGAGSHQSGWRARFREAVGRIVGAAKTADGVRTMGMRPWLHEELHGWRALMADIGLPAGQDDLIIPGAAPDGHYILDQQHNFIRDIKACGPAAAERNRGMAFLKKASPYSL